MIIDYRKRCVVPMYRTRTAKHEFDLIIYGQSARDLMTVPNEVIGSIGDRHPDYTSSPFAIYDL